MKAIRVNPRRKGATVVHLLLDEGRTLCGRKPAELDVVATIETDRLSTLDGCGLCRRVHEGWAKNPPGHRGYDGDLKITAEPAKGRVRKTGSLSHGTRSHRGSRMGGS